MPCRLIWLCGVLLAAAAGCSTDDQSSPQSAVPEGPWQLRALTFNAALAPGFEPYAAERRPKVLSALRAASQQLDVLCVQEFWVEADFAALVSATHDTLPFALHPEPRPGSGVCSGDELERLGACVQRSCAAPAVGDRAGCIQSECASEVGSLSGGCQGCLINHLDDRAQCASSGGAVLSDPAIFGGDSDIGLLSRYAISKQQTLPLDAYFQRGAVLYAQVQVPNLGHIHAFCTHLSSALGVIPYAGPNGSWAGEHARETQQLLDFIQLNASDGAPILVLGDLNTGLAINGQGKGAVLPDDFARLQASGLSDPFVDGGQAACSECRDNAARGPDSTDDLVDHLLLKNFPAASSTVTRSFTNLVSLLNEGTPIKLQLSDHYGIRLELNSRSPHLTQVERAAPAAASGRRRRHELHQQATGVFDRRSDRGDLQVEREVTEVLRIAQRQEQLR